MNTVTTPGETLGLSWPLLMATLFASIWLLQPVSPFLGDPDTYWHIATGRWIVAHGAVPVVDTFSHTTFGQPWLAAAWLSDVIFAVVHDLGGWNGIVFLAIACGALTLAALGRFMCDRMPALYAFIFMILVYVTVSTHLLARPHILAWPLLVVWVSRLVQATEQKTPPPWWLPGIMALWANLHGSFILGLVIAIPLGIEAILDTPATRRKTVAIVWARFAALTTLAALCSPHGWQGLVSAFEIMEPDKLQRIAEFQSADFSSLNPLETWIYVLLALSCLGYLTLPIMRLFLLLGVLHMALAHFRYISIFGLVTPLLIATAVGKSYRARTEEPGHGIRSLHRYCQNFARPASARAMVAGVSLVCLVALPASQIRERTPDSKITPAAALDRAEAAGLTHGRVFNDYKFGGYLIYRGIPVFIDGRMVGGNATLNTYLPIHDAVSKEQLASELDKSQVTWTLLPTGSLPAGLLDDLPEWQRIFADDIAVVHARRRSE